MNTGLYSDNSKEAIIEAIFKNRQALHCLSRRFPGSEVHYDENIGWCLTDLLDPFFNCVYHANIPREKVHGIIKSILKKAREKYINLWWLVCPWTRPPDIGEYLLGYGFQVNETTGMAIDLNTYDNFKDNHPDIEVNRVNDEKTLELWCRIAVTGFEMPSEVKEDWCRWYSAIGLDKHAPIEHYLARFRGEPVATASLFYAEGVVGIYNVATVPQYRRRGTGYTLMRNILHTAAKCGYQVAILQSSNKGLPLYKKLGFQEYCKVISYFWIVGPPKR